MRGCLDLLPQYLRLYRTSRFTTYDVLVGTKYSVYIYTVLRLRYTYYLGRYIHVDMYV